MGYYTCGGGTRWGALRIGTIAIAVRLVGGVIRGVVVVSGVVAAIHYFEDRCRCGCKGRAVLNP